MARPSSDAVAALYLIPTPLGAHAALAALPADVVERVRVIDCFLVEAPKTARAFLKAAGHPRPIASLEIHAIPEDDAAIDARLAPLAAGRDIGVLSEAGAPAIADPGAKVVRRAHAAGHRVVPLVGPSAITLALMASGLDGQRFAFHGYLPVEEAALATRLKALEAASRHDRATQIFIETPYRNDRMLRAIAQHCAPSTLVCVAADLTQPGESVHTRTVAAWREHPPAIGRRPAVFLLLAV
jgi:16S rRNA (cytidine1402-2'-O)-methyltransferase